jgi:hypothetical protein
MKLDNIKVGLQAGPVSVEGSWTPNADEQQAAWELYVELVTRVTVMKLESGEGMLREALSSLHAIFVSTRDILRKYGPAVAQIQKPGDLSFGYLAVVVLNYVLRPCLTTWHPALLDWEDERPATVSRTDHENAWEMNSQLRTELEKVRVMLIEYASLLATVAGVPTLVLEPNLSGQPIDARKTVLRGNKFPFEA